MLYVKLLAPLLVFFFLSELIASQCTKCIDFVSNIREEIPQTKRAFDRRIPLTVISSNSVEDWASLWEFLSELDFSQDSNLELLDLWLFIFHYWDYEKSDNPEYISLRDNAKKLLSSQ
jgi:hypothetical protein